MILTYLYRAQPKSAKANVIKHEGVSTKISNTHVGIQKNLRCPGKRMYYETVENIDMLMLRGGESEK